MLIINKPRIENNKLISKIEYENKEYELFFQVENEYIEYLCDDNANAFLVALLPFIVKHNYDVKINACISSKLYYQLTSYLLPLLCKEFKKKAIKIECELSDKKYTNNNGVGASVSCGVDSFYTLLKHLKTADPKNNITHLCFFNAGSNGEYGGEKAEKLFEERVSNIRKFCDEYNFSLITVNSNMNELILMNHEKRHTFTTLACVYSLEKLFNKYYFASGLGFNGSHISEEDTAYYDILNVHCLSNENISFYCSGIETSRMEKIRFISNYKETYNWLNVCISDKWDNCCKCVKCIRTMTALDSINMLEKYSNVFDIEYYNKNRKKILANILIGNRDKVQHDFCDEIIKSYKENNKKIPKYSYFLSIIPTKSNIKILLKKFLPNKFIDSIRKNKNRQNDGWID